MKQAFFSIIIAIGFVFSAQAKQLQPFQLKDGDRVVFLGDTLIERMQEFNHLELRLTTAWPKRNIVFRNLGWSGDTPRGISRAGLSLLQAGREPADEGWKQLQKQIELVKPTVVFLGYGMASSFEGKPEKFRAEMQALMDTIRKQIPKVRFVILSPIRHESVEGLSNAELNHQLAAHTIELDRLAQVNGAQFIEIFLSQAAKRPHLTQNGIHPHDAGYHHIAKEICLQLKVPTHPRLDTPQADALRGIIGCKNKLFFDRLRPQNMAYIFGFRKHEQGNNAVEIPKFDPLVAAEENKIAARRDLPPLKKQPPKKAAAPPVHTDGNGRNFV